MIVGESITSDREVDSINLDIVSVTTTLLCSWVLQRDTRFLYPKTMSEVDSIFSDKKCDNDYVMGISMNCSM